MTAKKDSSPKTAPVVPAEHPEVGAVKPPALDPGPDPSPARGYVGYSPTDTPAFTDDRTAAAHHPLPKEIVNG